MEPRVFFDRVRETHAGAVNNVGLLDFHFELAGHPITASFASKVLYERLTPALMHCEVSASRTSGGNGRHPMRILVWDADSTGATPPSPPWGPYDYLQKGRIRGFNRDGLHTAYHVGENVLSMFDEQTYSAVFWAKVGSALGNNHDGSPFLVLLQWWAEFEKLTLIHAGAVGTREGGVLLVGAGGSGKSTTAMSCLGSRLGYVSDDYCLLSNSGGDAYRAHTLYNTGKLDDFSLSLLPHLESTIDQPKAGYREKGVMYVQRHYPEQIMESVPVLAILLPRPAAGPSTTYRPASPAKALHALAPSTLFQLTGAGSEAFAQMGRLVRSVPSFYLDLGERMDDTSEVVSAILDEAA